MEGLQAEFGILLCKCLRLCRFLRLIDCPQLYWILWWHNMVLPALILWPVIISFRRRLQPYPVGQQLKEYQEQVALADSFSDRVSDTLASPTSALDIRELWRLAKLANNTRKLRLATSKAKSPLSPSTLSPSASTISLEDPTSPGPPASDAPAAEEQKVEQELEDLQTIGLFWITAIADLHERVHK
jgi:GRAM domain-containing protein 4